jgi:tRNA pseudouridine(55) synthase
MKDSKSVHFLYKNLGETPNEAILRWKKENPEFTNVSATYAGRLDPMAEGLLLVLTGEELHNKGKYLNLPKTYIFEILWGFKTDTYDLLGISEYKAVLPEKNELLQLLEKSLGKFVQKYPAFSSKPVLGKSLFMWARAGKLSEIKIPEHEVLIKKIKYLERREIKRETLLQEIQNRIEKVKGDFRQKEILEKWQENLSEKNANEFIIDKIEIVVSSGFYVRQFVADLSDKLSVFGTTFSIKRTKIDSYNFHLQNS